MCLCVCYSSYSISSKQRNFFQALLRYKIFKYLLTAIIIIGSIARSTSRRYLVYSKADFEVFRPAGVTRCTDGGEIWHRGGDRRFPPPSQISPLSVQRLGYRTPKLKFLLRFDQNVEYKCPTGAFPFARFS